LTTGKDGAAGIGGGHNPDYGGVMSGGEVTIGAGLSVEADASMDELASSVTVASYCAEEGDNHNGYSYARIYPATYKVSATASPDEGGTARAGAERAPKGGSVGLVAEKADGYEFDGWTLNPSGTGATIDRPDSATVTLTVGTADVTAVANCKKKAVAVESVAVEPTTWSPQWPPARRPSPPPPAASPPPAR
jgi:hypothetical protein